MKKRKNLNETFTKEFKCDICNNNFGHKSNLKKHIATLLEWFLKHPYWHLTSFSLTILLKYANKRKTPLTSCIEPRTTCSQSKKNDATSLRSLNCTLYLVKINKKSNNSLKKPMGSLFITGAFLQGAFLQGAFLQGAF